MKEMLSLHGRGRCGTLLPQFPQALSRCSQPGHFSTCGVSPPLGQLCSGWCSPSLCRADSRPCLPCGQLGSHTWGAADPKHRGKQGSQGQEGQQGRGSPRAAGGKPPNYHPLVLLTLFLPSCPHACQASCLAQAGLGTRGQFNDTGGGVSNPGVGTMLLRETFPAGITLLRWRNRGGSSAGTPRG